jgi:hypothetical protein
MCEQAFADITSPCLVRLSAAIAKFPLVDEMAKKQIADTSARLISRKRPWMTMATTRTRTTRSPDTRGERRSPAEGPCNDLSPPFAKELKLQLLFDERVVDRRRK